MFKQNPKQFLQKRNNSYKIQKDMTESKIFLKKTKRILTNYKNTSYKKNTKYKT